MSTSLDESISLINQHWPIAGEILAIFVAGVFLVLLRKRFRKIEARLRELSETVNRLRQLEERRFMVALKSWTIREDNSAVDPNNLSIVPEADDSPPHSTQIPVADDRAR
jgi:hypothetical protein